MPARKTRHRRTRSGLPRKTRLRKTRQRSSRIGTSRRGRRSKSSMRANLKRHRTRRRRRLGGDNSVGLVNSNSVGPVRDPSDDKYRTVQTTDQSGRVTGIGRKRPSSRYSKAKKSISRFKSQLGKKKCSQDTECAFDGVANSGQCRNNRCERIPAHVLERAQREKTAQHNQQRYEAAFNRGASSKYDDKRYNPATDGPNAFRYKLSIAQV